MKWLITGVAALAAIAIVVAIVMMTRDSADSGQVADFAGQGGEGQPLAPSGAQLVRAADGLRFQALVPTPIPGSYEYPTGDMIVDGSAPHPDVLPGGSGSAEVFTLWAFVFNYPDLCTDNACDVDDLDADAPAKGGVFQTDGRIAEEDELELGGSVRLGQMPATGSSLEDPMGAEVHVAIAPHGKALSGADLHRQLNGPLGNPTVWWAATFLPQQ